MNHHKVKHFSPLAHMVRHEIRLVMREPRFWIPFLVPPLFLVGMQAWAAVRLQGTQLNISLDPSLLLLVGTLVSSMSVSLTADSFAGERERNTLEILLGLPLSPRVLFMSKLLAILPFPFVLSLASQALLWSLFPNTAFTILLRAMCFAVAYMLLVTTLTLLVSLHSTTVRAAAQSSALFVLMAMLATQAVGPFIAYSPLAWLVLPVAILIASAGTYWGMGRFARTF